LRKHDGAVTSKASVKDPTNYCGAACHCYQWQTAPVLSHRTLST
jgi:hypothetical protein